MCMLGEQCKSLWKKDERNNNIFNAKCAAGKRKSKKKKKGKN